MNQIICHREHPWNPDHPTYSFEWVGPEDGIVGASVELLNHIPGLLALLPWKLEEVDRNENTIFYKRVTP